MELRGSGTLINCQGVETAVHYSFEVHQEVVRLPGGPAALGAAHSRGRITGPSGTHFPDGEYRLRTAEGRVLRIQRLVPEWHILASP